MVTYKEGDNLTAYRGYCAHVLLCAMEIFLYLL